MGRYADIAVANVSGAMASGAGEIHYVETPAGVLYCVYIDGNSTDVYFKKSTDGGLTWTKPVNVSGAITATNLAVWYDRWSGISAGLIHIAFTESAIDDTFYRTIDTESSDTLSTLTTIFAGASTAAGGHLSIVRARGGNVYCKTVIDAGAEGGFYRLANANVPSGAWDAARTVDETIATKDQMFLVPGFAADNQDIMAIFVDASANEISRKIYDDSANSWAETSIATSFVELDTATAFPNVACAVDLTNSRIVVIGWNATDAANQDLLCWTVTESAITAKTNVVTNATDDCGLAALSIDNRTGYWHAYYCGKSDGSQTWNTALGVYKKVSQDAGTTWGPETLVSSRTDWGIDGLFGNPLVYFRHMVLVRHNDVVGPGMARMNGVNLGRPNTTGAIGI